MALKGSQGRRNQGQANNHHILEKNAGHDRETIEMPALDREAYRIFVSKRAAYIQKWEDTEAEKVDTPRSQRIELHPTPPPQNSAK